MFGEARNPLEKEICELEKQMLEIGQKITELRKDLPAEEVKNYTLKNMDGSTTSLEDLFGENDELILVHNMGPGCSYCTLWADGFKGFVPYLKDRCSFALEMDGSVERMSKFAKERAWNFTVVSSEGSHLKQELGFQRIEDGEKSNFPGVSSFYKENGKIYRHATAPFGPGDVYCSPWHFFSLLKKGINGWRPSFQS